MVLGADERVRSSPTLGNMRTVDSMVVDLLVQVLPQLFSSREAMDLCVFVLEERGEFLTIRAVAIQCRVSFPGLGWLGLLCCALSKLVDAKIT